jgi:hypothetical protein
MSFVFPREKGKSGLWFLISVSFLMSIATACAAAQSTSTAEELTRQATFVFRGTVEKTGASTMPAVRASESTAVVRVDEVIDGPGAPPDLVGKQITVQLREPRSMKAGEQAVFFTKGWLLGNSMAVVEVGRQPASAAVTAREQVKETRQKIADEHLQVELETAEAVVVGKVISVHPSQIPHLGSEHDPDWYVAQIEVERVLQGDLRDRELTLLFAHSDDVQWHNSPKYKEGQTGIFLLHRNQARLPGIENQFTTLKPLDFRSPEELNRVERLIKAGR